MDIMIKNIEKAKDYKSFELSCGKKDAEIYISYACGYVNVLCKNASHKAYRGSGNYFHNGWQEAIDHYKTSTMKSMIRFARDNS